MDQRESPAYPHISVILWLKYVELGGKADKIDVEAHIHNLVELPPMQRSILDHALWELSEGW